MRCHVARAAAPRRTTPCDALRHLRHLRHPATPCDTLRPPATPCDTCDTCDTLWEPLQRRTRGSGPACREHPSPLKRLPQKKRGVEGAVAHGAFAARRGTVWQSRRPPPLSRRWNRSGEGGGRRLSPPRNRRRCEAELIRGSVAQFQRHLLAARDGRGEGQMRDEIAWLKHRFTLRRVAGQEMKVSNGTAREPLDPSTRMVASNPWLCFEAGFKVAQKSNF